MNPAAALDRLKLDWIVPDWPAPRNVHALVTTRNGGVSTGECATMNLARNVVDDPDNVAQNQALLRAVTGVDPVWMSQVHGINVIAVDTPPTMPVGDAALARHPGRAVAVRIADCLPVLFCDRDGTCVAAAHAGWRGLAAGILEATIEKMRVDPAQLLAWFGPAIGPEKFEVGEDVLEAFVSRDQAAAAAFKPHPEHEHKWLADLFALASIRLDGAGVTARYGGGLCTVSNPDRFFSHRRDRTPARMAALIWLD